MTVCVAAIFQWNYSQVPDVPDYGPAIITASDRMLTVEEFGIQYEPPTAKTARVTPNTMVLCAENIVVHSEVLERMAEFIAENPTITTKHVAELYSQKLVEYKSEQSVKYSLSLYGLDADTYLARQKDMDKDFLFQLAKRMEDYEGTIKVEALVVGCEGSIAHIYHIDRHGVITCHDDVGFASIGIGTSHANAQFMLHRYVNRWRYHAALRWPIQRKRTLNARPGLEKIPTCLSLTGWTVRCVSAKKYSRFWRQHMRGLSCDRKRMKP